MSERLAAIDGEIDAVDRLQQAARLAIDEAREPGLRNVEDAPEIARSTSGAGLIAVHRPRLAAAGDRRSAS